MTELLIKSSIDATMQKSSFVEADGENRPLIVALHTWSFPSSLCEKNYLPFAEKLNWHLLFPNFRGVNTAENPNVGEACGSKKAMQDIIDAVNYVCENYSVDKKQIFIMGGSGGGHMALMMCGYAPTLWRCAVAYVPISDVGRWYYEKMEAGSPYAQHILACMGGKTPDEASDLYARRSPINYIDEIALSNLKIYHGKFDATVPVGQSIDFYSELQKRHPSSRVFLDVFDGKHEGCFEEGFNWILSQLHKKNIEILTG